MPLRVPPIYEMGPLYGPGCRWDFLVASPNVRGLEQLGGIAAIAAVAVACSGNDPHVTFGSSGGTLDDELEPAR